VYGRLTQLFFSRKINNRRNKNEANEAMGMEIIAARVSFWFVLCLSKTET